MCRIYLTQYQHHDEERQDAHGRSFVGAVNITLLYEKGKKGSGHFFRYQQSNKPGQLRQAFLPVIRAVNAIYPTKVAIDK